MTIDRNVRKQNRSLWVTVFISALILPALLAGQGDSIQAPRQRKNVVRYNISGPFVFGADRYVVLGYERVLGKRMSVSVNAGKANLPRLISISTDLFDLQKDKKNTGYNASLDYRFYPGKDNKHPAPRGVYFGPYLSYNKFIRETRWTIRNSTNQSYADAVSEFEITTLGFQIGYQFIFWKRLTLDLVMFGPGWGWYKYETNIDADLDLSARADLLDGLEQLLTQRYPGANILFADKHISADGVLKTRSLGYRYVIHIGFNF